MGCHVLDCVWWSLKLNAPTKIEASCSWEIEDQFPFASMIHYDFEARGDMPPLKIHWYDGGLLPKRPEILEAGRRMGDNNGGVIFMGDKGSLMCGCYSSGPRLIPETDMKKYTPPAASIPRIETSHEMNWINACKTGEKAISDFSVAGPFTEMVLLGNLAVRCSTEGDSKNTHRVVNWDSQNLKAVGAPELDELINTPYRDGWSLKL
jgi:hypothetical protein